ncbi:hypothetical protein BJY00DRAFT_313779 [Aspergillus carlsbadensis]|nr:hypothetical protein BJY00DRAFT_313779 [Aspergillus carlsbadensis]
MVVCTVIANILKQEGHRPCVKFEDVHLLSTRRGNDMNTGLGFYVISSNSSPANNDKACHEERFSALSKCRQRVTKLAQLLNAPTAIGDHGRAEEIWRADTRPLMRVRDSTLVMDEAFSSSQAMDTCRWNLFASTEFHFPTTASSSQYLTSTQHMQVSCPALKQGDALFTEDGRQCFDRIDIVSGLCTFNESISMTSLSAPGSGKLDADQLTQAKPTLNEMESIARSSSAIADIAAMAISRIREQHSGLRLRINLDIPSWHYYHSAMNKFAHGLCTATEALGWMDAVDRRHDQIGRVFMESVRYELGRRGIRDHSSYEIRISSKGNAAALLIRKFVSDGEVPSVDNVLQALHDEEDGLWSDFYLHIPLKERPKDFEALGYLYYVFEVAKSALTKTSNRHGSTSGENGKTTPKPRPRQLIISVDDPAERRIYSRAQDVLKKIRASSAETDPMLVEVYLCRRVVVNGNLARARLYYHDPAPEVPTLFTLSEGHSDLAEPVMPLDVVRRLYGSDCAQNLQRCFADVGL